MIDGRDFRYVTTDERWIDTRGDHSPLRGVSTTVGGWFGDDNFILNVLRRTNDLQRLRLDSVKRLSPNVATTNLENSEFSVHVDPVTIKE